MADRITVSVLSVLCMIGAGPLTAQDMPIFPAGAPYVQPAAANQGAMAYSASAGAPIANPAYASGPPAVPVPYCSDGYGPNGEPAGPYMGPDCQVYEALPADRGWDYETPLDVFLKQCFRNTWVRLEYLNFQIRDPGRDLLGTGLLDVLDTVREPFDVFDPATGDFLGTATVADVSPITLDNINGIRGTWGMEFTFGTFEANVWGLEQEDDVFKVNTIPDPGVFVGTSTFLNGQLANTIQLYDESFTASFRSEVAGTEANVILASPFPGEGLKVRPLFGFRYINFQERLLQIGVFDNGGTIDPVVTRINSKTNNNTYGPQLGVRAELVHRWFTIGVEPKIAFGINTYSAEVDTERFRTNDDPTVITTKRKTEFSPVAELGVYARVHPKDWLSIHVGYNLIWAGGITRPHDNIFYNDNGPLPTPAGVVLRPNLEDVTIDGLTVGGEIRFK